MINKDLLSEVLGVNVQSVSQINDRLVSVDYFTGDNNAVGFNEEENIHELAHKCKEWALSLDEDSEVIDSCTMDMKIKSKLKRRGFAELLHNNCRFTAETEPEAIFKACQWIKDNKC